MKNRKISESIKAKRMTEKLITLRQKAILSRAIKKHFPYITIEKIKIDFFHLPTELNTQYSETLKEQKEIYKNEK